MNKLTFSNLLIVICIIVTIFYLFFSNLWYYWMNLNFLIIWDYFQFSMQLLLYQFLHWWLLHLFGNSLFLYIFGNMLESYIWKRKYILFFVLNTIFVAIFLLFFSKFNTIWISWFNMALLTYIWLILKKNNNPDYKGAISFIIFNILIWFWSNISLAGHLAWAIFWMLFYYFSNLTKKK